MLGQHLVLGYVEACSSGMLPLSECDPVWQLGIIGVLLVVALLTLVHVHFRMKGTPSR